MNDAGVVAIGMGAATPVGRDAWATAAAVRAAISGFSEHPYISDSEGEPLRVAAAPWIDISAEADERFAQLLLPAMDQALEPLRRTSDVKPRVACALCLPAPRPGLPEALDSVLREGVLQRYREHISTIALFSAGHAAGFMAMDAALQRIAGDTFDMCLIAGVDSYLEADTLEWLEENDRVHGAGPLNNAWGFIPGEGAGAVLLASAGAAQRYGLEPLGRLLSAGQGFEQNRIYTDTVCIAEGLTQAFHAALAGAPSGGKVSDVYCDLNGEPYRADEYGFTALRTKESFAAVSDFVAPASCWGDVSSATAPLLTTLALIAGAKKYAKGRLAVAWASSESGERAAVLIDTQPGC